MIGSLDVVVLDCPDTRALARFYAELLGGEIVQSDEDWAEIVLPNADHRPIVAFQHVEEYHAPEWPGQRTPQQIHLDVKVDDFAVAEPAVLAIGATRTGVEEVGFRVYLDPAGHPFCLIVPNDDGTDTEPSERADADAAGSAD
jgi:catechol 2,3-dioxygenase-like lactoylglutathione lyase family enzyme